jgi:protein-disulfide isomerase/uncharacterized membrane protein
MSSNEQGSGWIKLILLFGAVGLGLSLYATNHHYELLSAGATDSYCNINEQFSCDEVARSAYSQVLGIPLGVWGIGFFLGQLVLGFLAFRRQAGHVESKQGLVALTFLGATGSIVLAGISAFILGKFCLNCMGIYVVCFTQVAIVLANKRDALSEWQMPKALNGLVTSAITLGLVVLVHNWVGPMLSKPVAKTNSPSAQSGADAGLNFSTNKREVPIDRSAYSGMGEDFRNGPDDAKVVIVEFADFQCPACKSAFEQLKQVKKMYGDQVQLVFKNYPLDKTCNSALTSQIHPFACSAAALARCAGADGKFWEAATLLYEKQGEINAENIIKWASELGLSKEKYSACASSKDVMAKISDDVRVGNDLGVNSTPTIYINGRQMMGGRTVDVMQAEIDRELAN